jgi:hypothetical protein
MEMEYMWNFSCFQILSSCIGRKMACHSPSGMVQAEKYKTIGSNPTRE